MRKTGIAAEQIQLLRAAIPQTQTITYENREELWQKRRALFFKPAGGFGGKAAYRGDKVTRRVWEQMKTAPYVAQALVPPSERHISASNSPGMLKADVRNYAYAGNVKLVAARLYQGQTTNFRTSGGGFAAVFTKPDFPAGEAAEARMAPTAVAGQAEGLSLPTRIRFVVTFDNGGPPRSYLG